MMKRRLHRFQKPVTQIVLLITIYCLLITSIGCDAFVRKFTRKPKKDQMSQQEMVIAPEEYKGPNMTKEELYRQYFLFWQSWQEELITSLNDKRSQKKILDCLKEALKNLNTMRSMLDGIAQKKLDAYIADMNMLAEEVRNDLYGTYNSNTYRQSAEHIKMDIMRDFSYAKIKNNLI